MKKYLFSIFMHYSKSLLFLFLFMSTFVLSQSSSIEWTKCFGGSNTEIGGTNTPNYIQTTKDGGFIIISTTFSNDGDVSNFNGGMDGDIWVIKLTSQGNIQWQTCIGGLYGDQPHSITETSDSSFIVLGNTYSTNLSGFHGSDDVVLSKINKNGTVVFTNCIGGIGSDAFLNWFRYFQFNNIVELPGSGYLIAFDSYSSDGDVNNNYGLGDICLMLINESGQILNTKVYGGSSDDRAISILKSQDNSGFLILGTSKSNNGDFTGNLGGSDLIVFKVDQSLNLIWTKRMGSLENDDASSLIEDNNGNILIAGRLYESYSDVVIYKLDNSGNLIFTKVFGGSGDDTGNGNFLLGSFPHLFKNNNNEYFFTSYTNSTDGDISQNYGGYDNWVVKIDSNGTIIWEKTFGGIYDECNISNLIIQPNDEVLFGIDVRHSSGNLSHSNFHTYPSDPDGFGFDVGIIKLNTFGNTLFYDCFGGVNLELISNLTYNDVTNQLTFCGYTSINSNINTDNGDVIGYNGGYSDIWVVNFGSSLSTNFLFDGIKSKSLVNIFDLMGRETKPVPNQMMLYLYDDGSVEKKIIID